MYDNKTVDMSMNAPCVASVEDSLQSMVGEIMEMARHSRGMSSSIQNGLFGPQLQENKKETNISCMADALKEVRYILGETINTLESISRKL